MKFYLFEEFDFDYMAIIWADSKKQALKTYKEVIGKLEPDNKNKPSVIDVNDVFQAMINTGFDGDREHMAVGHIGELYKIITSEKPLVILHNCQ